MAEKADNQGWEDLLEYPSEKSSFSWQRLVQNHPLQIGLAGLGLVMVVLSAIFLFRQIQADSQVTVIPIEENQDIKKERILVHVAGAVQKPGLYELESDARINDVLAAAGGLSEEANREWFSKNINLAQKVSDGVKLYVPFSGETGVAQYETGAGLVMGEQNGLVNINTASQAELETLPKIGPATAQKIINYRQQHDSFQSIEELTQVSGIGDKTLEDLRNLVTVF